MSKLTNDNYDDRPDYYDSRQTKVSLLGRKTVRNPGSLIRRTAPKQSSSVKLTQYAGPGMKRPK